jgi:hypothetical protein
MGFVAHIDSERLRTGGAGAVDFDGAVGGAHDAHIMAECGQFLGEGARHIGETSYFHERFNFGGDEQNS